MITKVKHIHPLTNIRRERVLPIAGQVLTRRMQRITPSDVIVSAPTAPQYLLLDIAQGLKVSPTKADELLQRQAGDELSEGDVIAGPVGLFQRVIRAPQAGEIKIAGDGKVLFEITSQFTELQAGMDGTVTNIIPERGAILETRGTLIQGIWGNGKIAYGVIQPLDNQLDSEVDQEKLDISLRGAIMIGGYCTKAEALDIAASIPIKGMVLASISASLIPKALSMPYPVLIVDGFGSLPMNVLARELLVSNRDRNIALNAQKMDSYQGEYPEIIISLPTQKQPETPVESDELAPGQRVIIVHGSEVTRIGQVEKVLPGIHTFPSGIQARAVEITTAAGDPYLVPLNNVRLLINQEL